MIKKLSNKNEMNINSSYRKQHRTFAYIYKYKHKKLEYRLKKTIQPIWKDDLSKKLVLL